MKTISCRKTLRKLSAIALCAVLTLSLLAGCGSSKDDAKKDSKPATKTEQNTDANETDTTKKTGPKGTPFGDHGALAVDGTDLVDQDGQPYQLKGVSTHGLAWFPQYVNEGSFRYFRDQWGANLIRLALYTDENGGYCTGGDQAQLEKTLDDGVQAATNLGMYVLIDWHILHDETPKKYEEQAKTFFAKMTEKYQDYPNVLYEICNEPNGATSWADVKSYAEDLLPVIRKNAPDAVVIVGTPCWSQEVDQAAADPITDGGNLMYTLHFYAATHKDDLRNKAIAAHDRGLPIFVTEFSVCDASGNGGIDDDSAAKWYELIKKYNWSFAGWNLSNKDESSSLLLPGTGGTTGDWKGSDFSETGKWLEKMVKGE